MLPLHHTTVLPTKHWRNPMHMRMRVEGLAVQLNEMTHPHVIPVRARSRRRSLYQMMTAVTQGPRVVVTLGQRVRQVVSTVMKRVHITVTRKRKSLMMKKMRKKISPRLSEDNSILDECDCGQ